MKKFLAGVAIAALLATAASAQIGPVTPVSTDQLRHHHLRRHLHHRAFLPRALPSPDCLLRLHHLHDRDHDHPNRY